MACSSNCPTRDCPSYGACLRRKGIQVADIEARKFNAGVAAELNEYRRAREAGLQPASTQMKDVQAAWRISDDTGTPFRADQ